MVYGSGKFVYELIENWAKLPAGWEFGQVTGVATDSKDRVYAFNRSEHPVIVLDRDGNFLKSWGESLFSNTGAHGIFIGPGDVVYCADWVDHVVLKLNTDGELLMTLGTKGQPSDSGFIDGPKLLDQMATIKRAGPPFNKPTQLIVAPSGELFASDGYGNAAIHRFTAEGRHLLTFGGPGTGPGQFRLPHGLDVSKDGRVYLADRENSRVQVFSSDGKFLAEWANLLRPADVFIDDKNDVVYTPEIDGALSITDYDGKPFVRIAGPNGGPLPALQTAHSIWMDSRGDLYVGLLGRGSKIIKLVRK